MLINFTLFTYLCSPASFDSFSLFVSEMAASASSILSSSDTTSIHRRASEAVDCSPMLLIKPYGAHVPLATVGSAVGLTVGPVGALVGFAVGRCKNILAKFG